MAALALVIAFTGACATIADQQQSSLKLSPDDLKSLTGSWEGTWMGKRGGSGGIKIRIFVDLSTNELKGRYEVTEGEAVYRWVSVGSTSKRGEIVFSSQQFYREDTLVLRREGAKAILSGTYRTTSVEGTLSLEKKNGVAPAVAVQTPLPFDVKIVPPRADVPKDAAVFSGKWVGFWDGQLPTTLVVEEITPPTAKVIYSWGQGSDFQAGFRRYVAEVRNGMLQFGSPERRMKITFTLSQDSTTLEGIYERGSLVSLATLTRVKE